MTTDRNYGGQSIYEIKVLGKLRPGLSEWFGGMEITFTVEHNGAPVTTLRGNVADQARLHGLLIRVRDLGLVLLAVARMEEE